MSPLWDLIALAATVCLCRWWRCIHGMLVVFLLQVPQIPLSYMNNGWDTWYAIWLVNIPLEAIATVFALRSMRFRVVGVVMFVHVYLKILVWASYDLEYQFPVTATVFIASRWVNRAVFVLMLYTALRKEQDYEQVARPTQIGSRAS